MRIPRFPAVVLVLAVLSGTASATIVIRATVEDLAEKATLVVGGEVLESKARWTEDRSTINTYVRVRVDEVLKGSAGGEVSITCPGGVVGKEKVDVHGVPRFAVGERVVVFLWKNADGELLPLGLNQGKFSVEEDPDTGKTLARNSLEGLAFATRSEAERKSVSGRKPDVLELSLLKRRVRERLELIEKREREAREAAERAEGDAESPDGGAETGSGSTSDHAETPPAEDETPGTATEEQDPAGAQDPEPEAPTGEPEKKKPGEEAPPGRR